MANGNWWDKYADNSSPAVEEDTEDLAPITTQTPAVEEAEEPAIPTVKAAGGNWWDKYAEPVAEAAKVEEDPDKALTSAWEKSTAEFDSLKTNYEKLGARYQELGAMEVRTPEQEQELQKTWNDLVGTSFDVQSSLKKVQDLQPQIDDYYNRQKQNRIDYIEERRNTAIFGDEVADALYDLDARSEADFAKAREIPNKDQRKQAIADLQAKYQTEEKQLLQSRIDGFKENETKINNAADVIGQAFAAGKTVDQFLLEDMAGVAEYDELRDSLINQYDPEKGQLFREARAMYELATGQKRKEGPADTWKFGTLGGDGATEAARVAVINNEIRISPLHVWDGETIKQEIAGLDISDTQKQIAIANIPKMQEEAAKVELPFLQKVNEFNDFVKENGLEGADPKEQISQWKNRNRNWTEYITKAPAQVGLGLAQGALGLLEAGQAIIGATASTMGAYDFADPFLDAASQTSEKVQEFNRISQEIGGPTILGELAAVVPQIALQIGVGGAVGFGGSKLGLKPKTVSNLGFGSSVGTALAQSYGGVLFSSIQQLEKEKIDGGMDPTQARAEAVKESQIPAALSGLATGIITLIGGKRGVEAPFRGNLDDIKAALNTSAFRAELPKFVPNVFKGMRNEGYEEFFDQIAQGIIEQATFNPDLSTSDIVTNAFKALVIGGITGGSVEGLKYGFDYVNAPKEMARRKMSMASIRESIATIEQDIAESSASSPIGSEFEREYDMTTPSQEAAALGGVAVDRTRMAALQSEREQLQNLLEDDTLTRVARNELEARLAVADYNYYNDVLVGGRSNILTEQIVDELDSRPLSASSRDAITALTKIANNRGLDSLTGRERVAVGITKVGDNRYLPSKQNPMVATDEQGNVSITNTGKRVAEATGIVPLSRMIGFSEQMKAKQEEMAKAQAAIQEEAEKQEAKKVADSEEAKRYGPASAEALKQQINDLPKPPEPVDTVVARLLEEEKAAQAEAEQAFAAEIENRFAESFRQNLSQYLTPTETQAATIDLGAFRSYLDSIAPQIEADSFDINILEQGEFKRLLPAEAYNVVVEAFREDPKRALKALRAFGDEIENAIKQFGGGAAGAVEEPAEVVSLRRVARAEQTPEDVDALVKAGFVEVYNGQPVITQAGLDALPEADRPRLTPEARKIQIDTGASDVIAEAISKNLRIGADQVPPAFRMPEGWTLEGDVYVPPQKQKVTKARKPKAEPRAALSDEEQAKRYIEAAKKDRAKNPPAEVTIDRSKTTPLALALDPKVTIGLTVREALRYASRINISRIANEFPNEALLQDAAAILAELNIPALDNENIVKLSSLGRKGRAVRAYGGDIGLPSTLKEQISVLVHEAGHSLTADQIRQYAPRGGGKGKVYIDRLRDAINNQDTPPSVARLFSLYISTLEQLGVMEQYGSVGGIAGTLRADTSRTMARRLQAKGQLRTDLDWSQLYALANVEEFVSQTFSSETFRNLLKTLKDPTNPTRSVWSAFVDAIKTLLSLPDNTMAAAVIESSVDIAMQVPSVRTAQQLGVAPSPAAETVISAEEEAQYNDAVANNDIKAAQKIVDRIAKRLGFNSENLLFHGTTHIFNVFKRDRANIENDFGKGYYFTNTESDAQVNYAGEGPDLTNRIERLAEQLQDNENLDENTARAKAKEILSGGGQRIIRAYINLQNPFTIGGPNETFLDFDYTFDEATQEYGEPTGKLADFINTLRPVIESYAEDSPVNANQAVGNIMEAAMDSDGLTASELINILGREDSGIMWASDENEDSATREIIRQAIEDAGFDGIVDNLVNQKFGTGKKLGTAMKGMGPDTVHTIVFSSNQIKSADAITRDADGNIIPLRERFDITRPEIEYAPEGETVEMSLEMEKERTFQLLGERLYTAELPKVVVKETTQNAFDAIKDAEETGEIARGSGLIVYSCKELEVNGEKIVRMAFTDNGAGMTPEILQNAFFTVGGTFKRSGKGSGGFGLAKLGMFMSADRVMVETVRDGVVTTADLSKQELIDKKFNVNVAKDPNRKNGTMVILEFKKEITRSDGKTVQFNNPYAQFDKLIYHDVAVIDDSYGTYQKELIDLFQNKPSLYTIEEIKVRHPINPYTFESFVKEVPNVETFEQDFAIAGAKKPIKVRIAAARLGYKQKNGKAKWNEEIEISGVNRTLSNYNMSVLSNGLFQFEQTGLKMDPMKIFGSELLPYSIIVDVDAGGLDAASVAYPFTNSREDFQNGVVKDYVNKILNKIRVKERQRQFDQEFGLLTDINGGKPRKDSPTLYNNTTIVPEPSEQKFLEDLTKAVFDVADDLVVTLRKGQEDGILEDNWHRVKSQKGSVTPTGKSQENDLDYFYGVGISKNWGGVNTSREPMSALVNPIYEERVDEYARTEFGRRILARTIAKTLIHEINHHLHRNEGSDFTFFILQNEAYLGEVGAIQSAVDKILPIVNNHPDAIISLKNKFRTAETKDTDNELTGEQYERSSKEADGQPRTVVVGGNRVIQQPQGEVSPRPTSEEDSEQAGAYLPSSLTATDRQNAGIGEGIPFGEIVAAEMARGAISPQGTAIEVAPAAEGEFVIRPEEVVPPQGGTAEAAAVKVMSNVMKLGDAQSAKLGTPEGTLPLETIVSAWLNSGLDQAALENAILRYTNLSEQSAANFAQAFAKQYKIQQDLSSLASAREKEAKERTGTYSLAERIAGELPTEVADKMSRTYEVLRNEVSAEEADKALRNLSLDQAINVLKDFGNGISFPVRSMMAQIIERRILEYRANTKKSNRMADYDAAVDVHIDFVNWMNDYAKELGQGVQAFAQWINLGPDGIARKLRRDTAKIVDQNIKSRRKKIDKIKQDVEEGDNKSFKESTTRNKKRIEDLGEKAGKEEAKRVTIEDDAQKIAQRLAKRVEGKVKPRKLDPLSELVNAHIRKLNNNFVQEAIALGVSPDTAAKIDASAKKLDADRKAAKDQREAFRKAQEARDKISRDLARENKYIYGERPTIWENYQSMFAERFARALLRDPKKTPPPALLLFTNRLTQNLVGFIPDTQKAAATPQSFQAFIEDALNNRERYQEAFNAAMEQISLRVEEVEARVGGGEMISAEGRRIIAAHEFMKNLAPQIKDFPVSEKMINRFVNQKAKALDISLAGAYNQWYKADRRTRKEMEQALADRLLNDVNIDSVDADRLAKAIVQDFKQRAEERRKKALERFKAPKEKIKADRAARTDKLQRFFELVNMGALTDRDAYEIFAERYQLPVYDEDFVAYVYEAAQTIQGMEDGLARRLKTQELMSEIARNRGFDPADLGAGFVYANILSSPDTHLVNILDTAINNFANGLADAIATGDTSRLRGIVRGYRKGIFEAAEVWKTGKRINVPGFEEKAPLILELLTFGESGGVKLASLEGANAIIKTILESKPSKILNAAKYVGRLLEAQDALNFSASVEGERYAQASRIAAEEGLTGKEARKRMNEILNISDEAYQSALQQALSEGYTGAEAKFRAMEIQDKKIPQDIKEASFARGLRDVYRNTPVGVAGLLSDKLTNTLMSIENPLARNVSRLTVSPFVITPINLFNKWLDWSPWGYKRMFFGTGGWAGGKYYVEPFEKGSPERRAQMLKASSGILVMTVLWAMVRGGLATIHGRGPSDEEERKQWLDDGNKPYTIQFGNGPALSFAYTPWALMLTWMANAENYYKYNPKDEDEQSAMWRVMAATALVPSILEELPFYQGVSDIFETAVSATKGDFEKSYTDFFEPKVAMLFPNLFRWFDRLFDPTVYNTDGVKALAIDQIPFVRRLGGPRLNMFGEPIGEGKKFYEQLATRFAAFPKPSRESRILAAYDAYPFVPSAKRAKALVDGEPAQMTPEQYDKFIRGMGQEFKQYLLDNYDPDVQLDPEEKEAGKKRISQTLEAIRQSWVREVSY